jgi:hypothetical protein
MMMMMMMMMMMVTPKLCAQFHLDHPPDQTFLVAPGQLP